MPFDPTRPIDDSLATAGELRNQFNGLADLINTNAAGPVASVAPLDSSATVADLVDKFNELLAQLKRQ